MERLDVKMLGHFDLCVDGQSVLGYLGNSSKAITLLQYLILNRESVIPCHKLIDLFWEGDEIANPENALRTMISRLRSSLAKVEPALSDCLLSEAGGYMWRCVSDCEIDVSKFEGLCEQVGQARRLDPETRELYMQILKIYAGDICPPVTNGWLMSKSISLHSLYLRTILTFLSYLEENQEYRAVIQICQAALNVDQFDENINLKLLGALKETNQKHAALIHYRHLTDLHYQSLGISPPKILVNFYKELIKDNLASKTDINAIRQELNSVSPTDGAFVCDYSIFKEIYQLHVRNHKRSGQTMLLAVISMNNTGGMPVEYLELDKLARDLLIIIQSSLRKGDMISRYGPTQFMVLLPIKNGVNGYEILNRIVRHSFYGQLSNPTVQLRMQVMDIGRAADEGEAHKEAQ